MRIVFQGVASGYLPTYPNSKGALLKVSLQTIIQLRWKADMIEAFQKHLESKGAAQRSCNDPIV